MITYKYCVHDDENKIADSCFDTFEEAFDYAQDGLVTFIEEVPYIDGVECEDEIEIVWSWDDTLDRDEAIAKVNGRHVEENLAGSPIDEDVDINVEVTASSPEELTNLARAMFGDNIEFLDQDFDEEPVPDVVADIEPVAEIPEESEEKLDDKPADPESAFEDDLFDEKPEDDEPETEEEKEHIEESFNNGELDRFLDACKKLGLNDMGDVQKFAESHGNVHDQDLLNALEAEVNAPVLPVTEGLEDSDELAADELDIEADEHEEIEKAKKEISESADDQVECVWCLSPMSKSECVHDSDFGWICKDCLPDVEKLGNRLHLDEPEEDDMSDDEFLEAFGKAMVEKHDSSLEESKDVPVVDCPVNDVITHSEDEKPLDCEMKKEPLEKPLTETLQGKEWDEYMELRDKLGLDTLGDVEKFMAEHGHKFDGSPKTQADWDKARADWDQLVLKTLRDEASHLKTVENLNETKIFSSLTEALNYSKSLVEEILVEKKINWKKLSQTLSDKKYSAVVLRFSPKYGKSTEHIKVDDAEKKDKVYPISDLSAAISDALKASKDLDASVYVKFSSKNTETAITEVEDARFNNAKNFGVNPFQFINGGITKDSWNRLDKILNTFGQFTGKADNDLDDQKVENLADRIMKLQDDATDEDKSKLVKEYNDLVEEEKTLFNERYADALEKLNSFKPEQPKPAEDDLSKKLKELSDKIKNISNDAAVEEKNALIKAYNELSEEEKNKFKETYADEFNKLETFKSKPKSSRGEILNRQISNNKKIAAALDNAGFDTNDLYVANENGKKKATDKLNNLRKELFGESLEEDTEE